MVNAASALALLAAALLFWPRSLAVLRLERATGVADWSESAAGGPRSWGRPRLPQSPWLRGLVAVGAVGALAQVWPWPVAAVVIVVGGTVGAAMVRGFTERAVLRQEQAAVEGLGVLVAELRAGRAPDAALAAAGRHCGHPVVGALLSRLGRSLRLGDRLEGWMDADEREPLSTDERAATLAVGGTVAAAPSGRSSASAYDGGSRWQTRLLSGVRLSQQTGCALADVLAAVESDLTRRGHQRADVRATAAGHRATVALLAGLPVLGLAMGSGIGAEPVRILTTTTIGHVLLATGMALELLGLAWSRSLTGRVLRER